MPVISFFVPGQPIGKGRPKIVKIGAFTRMATPEKTVNYEGLIATTGSIAMAGQDPLQGPIEITVDMVLQIPASWSQKKQLQAERGYVLPITKPDIDNVLKAICDGLNGIAWRDDSQVVRCKAGKRYGTKPGVHVSIVAVDWVWSAAQQTEMETA